MRLQCGVAEGADHRHRNEADDEERNERFPARDSATRRRRLRRTQVQPRQQRNDAGEEQVARQLGHRRDPQHHVVRVHLPVGQRRADDLRGVVHRGAEKQPDGFRALQQRVRKVRVDEHPEQAERDDVRHGIGDFALVRVDRRRRRDDGRHAADARAGGDQRAETRRQAEPAIEPGDEHEPGDDRGQHHGQAGEAKPHDVERAQADADEHDAEPQHRRHTELQARGEDRRQRQQVAQQQAENDRDGHAGNRAAAAAEPLRRHQRAPEHVGQPEAGDHHQQRGDNPRQQRGASGHLVEAARIPVSSTAEWLSAGRTLRAPSGRAHGRCPTSCSRRTAPAD